MVYSNPDIQQCVVKYLKCWNFLIPDNHQSRVQTGASVMYSLLLYLQEHMNKKCWSTMIELLISTVSKMFTNIPKIKCNYKLRTPIIQLKILYFTLIYIFIHRSL